MRNQKNLNNTNFSFENHSIQTRSIVDRGSYYIAKVESLVPAIGWGYICQDFQATVNSGRISNIHPISNIVKFI